MPTQSYSCKYLLSAIRNPETVSDLLSNELKKGYIIGPFDEPPFGIYRINPLGIHVAERKYSKKKRLIIDLSVPHNSDAHLSLIDKSEYSVSGSMEISRSHMAGEILLLDPSMLRLPKHSETVYSSVLSYSFHRNTKL